MRGKPRHTVNIIWKTRITPADAGKTHRLIPKYQHNQDHPRGCGENVSWVFGCRFVLGSPPRMRGKHRFDVCGCEYLGITPADAGKTSPYSQIGQLC